MGDGFHDCALPMDMFLLGFMQMASPKQSEINLKVGNTSAVIKFVPGFDCISWLFVYNWGRKTGIAIFNSQFCLRLKS